MGYEKDEKKDISEIQNWTKMKKFMPKDLTRPFIRTFLLGCNGNTEKAKTVLENYFYVRQCTPEIFTRRDPLLKENILAWKSSCFVPLRDKQNGCKVFLGTSLNSETYDYVNFVKQMFMCYDLLIKNNEWGNGDRMLVLSYDKITLENLQSFTLYATRKTVECERDIYLPGKLRVVHNVHIPPFMNKIYKRFKPYLTEEDKYRFIFHRDLRSLYSYVSPEILPLEFGGGAGPLSIIVDKWCGILKDHRDFFVEEEEKRVQETRIRVDLF